MYGKSRWRTLGALVVVVGAAVIGLAGPAQAAPAKAASAQAGSAQAGGGAAFVLSSDPIFIDTARIDLAAVFLPPAGAGSWIPGGTATLTWQTNGAPKLAGWVGMQNASGFCGRIRLDYRLANGAVIQSRYVGSQCPGSNGFFQTPVSYSGYLNNAVVRVDVAAELSFSGGPWLQQASATAWR